MDDVVFVQVVHALRGLVGQLKHRAELWLTIRLLEESSLEVLKGGGVMKSGSWVVL